MYAALEWLRVSKCCQQIVQKGASLLCILQTHPLLQVVLCASEPIQIPGVDCVTYELEDLGVDNVAQILTSIAPQVLLRA